MPKKNILLARINKLKNMSIYGKKVWFWSPKIGILYKTRIKRYYSHGTAGILITKGCRVLLDNSSDHEFEDNAKEGSFKIWKSGNCGIKIKGDNKLLIILKKNVKFSKYHDRSSYFGQGGHDTRIWTYLVKYKQKDIVNEKRINKRNYRRKQTNKNNKYH
jgi:hypothetical protein